jgi:hypothetical protein
LLHQYPLILRIRYNLARSLERHPPEQGTFL